MLGWQALEKWGFEAYEADFKKIIDQKGLTSDKALSLRNKYCEDKFKGLEPEDQAVWVDRAIQAHKDAKDAIRQRAATIEAFTPEERQA